ncbi:hypothetical protein R3Q06_11105 [Rhodococcus erythropolis]|uniref:hypothetical protein n=1 Tax=Rhodococcus erythropolis TaxID=1833 RepID=UPI00294A3923|nr:hypothetical protein [Rhodococcus erythropolis]MDV6274047.1 hypothetical protein [Rhodococcus erythropolis]
MIRTFDGLEVDTMKLVPAHNLSTQATDLAYGGYWHCELTGGGCVQQFGDELLEGPDEEHLTLVAERRAA